MADRVRTVNYCSMTIPGRAGQGTKVLTALEEAGVSLIALSGYPTKGGKAQFDLMAQSLTGIRKVARREGWQLSATRKGFVVQGDDQVGAVNRHIRKLADERINVVAADAVAAGKGRYGMILWVRPKDYARAARTLKAK
jgi:hypothetical protein